MNRVINCSYSENISLSGLNADISISLEGMPLSTLIRIIAKPVYGSITLNNCSHWYNWGLAL